MAAAAPYPFVYREEYRRGGDQRNAYTANKEIAAPRQYLLVGVSEVGAKEQILLINTQMDGG